MSNLRFDLVLPLHWHCWMNQFEILYYLLRNAALLIGVNRVPLCSKRAYELQPSMYSLPQECSSLCTSHNHGRCVVSNWLTNTVGVGDNDLLYVLDHGGFVGPVLSWVGDIPLWWKLESGMAPCCFPLVDHLDRQKVANQRSTKHGAACHMHHQPPPSLHPAGHGRIVTWDDSDTCLIQFRTNFGGISSISTVATTSSKNSLFTQSESVTAYLLFAVVAFLLTKFIRWSNEYVQCQLSSTCPPNSTNMDLSQVKTIPLAAAIAIHADTTPPPPLTFFQIQLHLLIQIITQ